MPSFGTLIELVAAYERLLALVGGAGIGAIVIGLSIAYPAVMTLVWKAIGNAVAFVLRYRVTVGALALAIGITGGYLTGTRDEEARAQAREAQAHAALLQHELEAAQTAAKNDQIRAAAAESARAQAEMRAHELEAKIPTTRCFAPADTERLRQLWPSDRHKSEAAGGPRTIGDLLRR